MRIAVFCPHKLIELFKNSLLKECEKVLFVFEEEHKPLVNEYHFKLCKDASYNFLIEHNIAFAIVYGWNHLIPNSILDKVEFYNIHPSALPRYRGPYPIVFQLIKREKRIGVTLHKIEDTYDSGPICSQEFIDINYDNLSFLDVAIFRVVKRLMLQLIRDYKNKSIRFTQQVNSDSSYFSKRDLLCCLNSECTFEDFLWMKKIFDMYLPFKVLLHNKEYIIEDYSTKPKTNYEKFALLDKIIYLKLKTY